MCVLCRRFEGAAYRPPPPDFWVKEEPPFTYTGVDYAGPLHVRTARMVKLRQTRHGSVFFKRLVTRAVHLEVVTDMSTETFIQALKRFSARRGVPRKFPSDNATSRQLLSFSKLCSRKILSMISYQDKGMDL